MSDENPWRSPGGDPANTPPASPPPPFPGYPAGPPAATQPGSQPTAQPAQPAQPAQQPAQTAVPPIAQPGALPGYPVPSGPRPGWTPPPKVGLIPLQPLTLGAILTGSFQVIRRNPRPTFGVSLLINGIVAIINILITGLVAYFAFDRVSAATSSEVQDILAGSTALSLVTALVTVVLGLLSSAILQGIISLEVSRATLGEKLKLSALWALAKGRIGVLIGWSILIVVAIGVAGGIVVTLIVLLALSNSTAGFVGAVLLGLLTVAIAIALAIWLGTKLSLVPSVLFLEHATLRTAIRRSWFLTSGNTYFWRTFGIEILVAAIVSVASYVVLVPVTVLLTIFSTLSNPNGSVEVVDNTFYVTLAVTTILTALISSITSIISTAATALIYIDLRMRREGLDLTLSRFVEARQVGDTSVADPYLPIPTSSQPGFGSTPQNGPPSNSAPSNSGPTNSAPSANSATDDRGGPPKDSPWV